MKIPTKKNIVTKKKTVKNGRGKQNTVHPKYGTSKLETYFEENFIKKLGLEYIYQFEAKSIGRFYDFCVFTKHGSMVLLEVDGSFFHSDPRLIKEEEMSPMQKRNKRVDALKDKWAMLNGIPLIRIWEKDIRENPEGVMKMLKERLNLITETEEKKKKRHNTKNK